MISKQALPFFVPVSLAEKAIPLTLIASHQFSQWLEPQSTHLKNWVQATGFSAEKHTFCCVPDAEGHCEQVLVGVDALEPLWQLAHLPFNLPKANYQLTNVDEKQWQQLALGWGLGAYDFNAFKQAKREPAALVIPDDGNHALVQNQLQAFYLVRDLINMPAETMGPEELCRAVETIGQHFHAETQVLVGNDLIENQFPAVHTVGRASNREPRIVELEWGDSENKTITLVGKGVCFDSGGLNIKSGNNMALMKKDMGGAAHALGLGCLIMGANLPVHLRIIIPAVDNVISGSAFKPGDIIPTRKGLFVEIGNTDAEGRLILADALAVAVEDKPDLLIDFATLTGAARVALGTEIPVMFCNHKKIAANIQDASEATQELIWQLPLYQPYRVLLDTPFADINNAGTTGYAGAITAALFLQEFVGNEVPWLHFDLMAWNVEDKPGRPKGGEAMGLRAVFEMIKNYLSE